MTAPAACVFCRIVARDEPADIVNDGLYSVAIRPLNPHAPGHVLFIPRLHIRDAAMHPFVAADTFQEAAHYAASLPAANIITSIGAEATQSVFHLHIHVIPRGPEDKLPRYWPWFKKEITSR